MKIPSFIIVGAAKSGTTTLYRYLVEDPRFCFPQQKEPEFFAREELYQRGIKYYQSLFDCTAQATLSGEASTLYSLHPLFPEVPSRIHHHAPDSKLIYLLRNPVHRAYSYYLQLIKNYQRYHRTSDIPGEFDDFVFGKLNTQGYNSASLAGFDAHLPLCPELITAGGMYATQIKQYLAFFPFESMHFIIFENFISMPYQALDETYQFLGISPLVRTEPVERKENISEDHFKKKYSTDMLQRIIPSGGRKVIAGILGPTRSNHVKSLLVEHLSSSKLIAKASRRTQPKPMSKSTDAYLKDLYYKPTVELCDLLDSDLLSQWELK